AEVADSKEKQTEEVQDYRAVLRAKKDAKKEEKPVVSETDNSPAIVNTPSEQTSPSKPKTAKGEDNEVIEKKAEKASKMKPKVEDNEVTEKKASEKLPKQRPAKIEST